MKILSLSLTLLMGSAYANVAIMNPGKNLPMIAGVASVADLSNKYAQIDKYLDLSKGSSKKAINSLGISDEDLVSGKVSCADVDQKSKAAFKAKTKSSEKRNVNLSRDVSSLLLTNCKLPSLK